MVTVERKPTAGALGGSRRYRPGTGTFVMAVLIVGFGFYVGAPVFFIFLNSFNSLDVGRGFALSMENWRLAFTTPGVLEALGNTFLVFGLTTVISFPLAIMIAWVLARTNVRYSYGLEFMFWVSFMLPGIAVVVGWTFLLDPSFGLLNRAFELLPFVTDSSLNIYSVEGIIFTHLMGNAISGKVMLLTPAFRNMSVALEEAAHVSGASAIRTLFRVTLPVMVPAMVVVFMLNLVRIFQSFEIELILGKPVGFYTYSTKIFAFLRFFDPPEYGAAAALASITLLIIALVIPLQHWLTTRRHYTTVTGQFKPGLLDLGQLRPFVLGLIVLLLLFLTVVPVLTLIGGSFMLRVGFFNLNSIFTMRHWTTVLSDSFFLQALRTTLTLALSTAILTPLIFSLIAYVLVRTRWRGRQTLDSIFWVSSAVPGMLAGLGLLWLFLGTPIFQPLYGTIWALLLVVILQGKLISTQLIKGVYLQMGSDMEEAARVSGAGWWYTYVRIWLPLIMPTLVLIGTLNFVFAAQATASIILLASRGTKTLSIMALEMMTHADGQLLEEAGIVSLFIVAMTVVVALIARKLGLPLGVSPEMRASANRAAVKAPPEATDPVARSSA